MEMNAFFEGSDFQKESLKVFSSLASDDEAERIVVQCGCLEDVRHPIYWETVKA